MDTSFWDDDEERVQIVYEDDQLQCAQALQEAPALSREPRRRFDLRERFAEAHAKAPVQGIPGPAAGIQEAAWRDEGHKQLYECATQALEAAAVLAADPGSPVLPAVSTPQVAKTGTDDASSSLQPHRHRSIANLQGLPGSSHSRLQHEVAAHNEPAGGQSPCWQAPIAPSSSQHAQQQSSYNKQIATGPIARSSKKGHPLYASAPSHGKKAMQQRKPKAKASDGFAIRLPATQAGSASKPFSTSDALRQLTGGSANTPSAVNERTAQEPRPGSIAELLSDIQVANHDDTIEEVEVQEEQQPPLHSPSWQDNTRSLLDSLIEGQAQPAERPLVQGHSMHDQTPVMAPAPERTPAHVSASTPSMTLQRQFIAGLQDTPAAPASQYSASRTRAGAAAGSLTARLNKVLQLEKAQHAQFEASGSLGRQTMNVTITEQCLEGRVIKCRCHKESNEADQLFVCFNSKSCHNFSLQIGCCVTLHTPWTEVHLEGCNIPVILCQFASACS